MSVLSIRPLMLAAGFLALGAGGAAAGCGGEVKFARGADNGTVTGTVSGYDTCDYTLSVAKGQVLSATLKAKPGVEVIVFDPVSHDFAEGPLTLPQSGKYTVRVLQPRAMARKGDKRDFALTLRVTGASAMSAPPKPAKPAMKMSDAGTTTCDGSGAFMDGTANMSGRIMGDGTCTYSFTAKAGQTVTPMMDAPAGFEAWITDPVNEALVADQPVTLTQSGTYTVVTGLSRNAARKATAPVDFSMVLNIE